MCQITSYWLMDTRVRQPIRIGWIPYPHRGICKGLNKNGTIVLLGPWSTDARVIGIPTLVGRDSLRFYKALPEQMRLDLRGHPASARALVEVAKSELGRPSHHRLSFTSLDSPSDPVV